MYITRECASNHIIAENENDKKILSELYKSIMNSDSKDNDKSCIEEYLNEEEPCLYIDSN